MDAVSQAFAGATLEFLRGHGDAYADALVADLLAEAAAEEDENTSQDRGKHFVTLSKKMRTSPEVQTFLQAADDADKLHRLIDPSKIRHAQQYFEVYGPQILSVLLHFSLFDAYACARGAQVLYLTGEFVSHPARRARHTAQLMIDMLSEDPKIERRLRQGGPVDEVVTTLHAGGRGAETGRRIRLFHAAVRATIDAPNDPRWASRADRFDQPGRPQLGKPVNQEDELGTLFSFSVTMFEGLDLLGVRFNDDDVEAWFHTWDIAGRHLGIGVKSAFGEGDPDHVNWHRSLDSFGSRLTPELSFDLMTAIRARHHEPSYEGKLLTNALLREIQLPLPRAIKPVPASLARYLVGPDVADMLGIRQGAWVQYWLNRVRSAGRPIRPLNRPRALRTPGGELAASVTREVLQMFMEQGKMNIDVPDRHGEAARSPFRLNDRLRRAWGLHGETLRVGPM